MTRMKKNLLVVAILAVLGIVGSAMQKAQPAVAKPALPSIPVTVTSPLPMPVSGTLSAQQSGTWNVGINGTPNVNIANSPTVNLASSAAAPFFVRNVDDPGRIPYQATVTGTPVCSSNNSCSWSFPAILANHRLVLEHVSGILTLTQAPQGVNDAIQVSNGNQIGTYFPVPPFPAGNTNVAFDQLVLLWVDGGTSLSLYPIGNFGTSPPEAAITVTGYLLDCSAGPCAPIFQQ
ncbi:MAG: hypothetical protein JOY62_11285 [Acidobacteriaceae bacterium]|nr:hypothetical protein [Acidobacteriaceae bacterium]MBV9780542.1 hypothetical protein [Acidobacteriaceae bacterium]